MGNPVKMEFGNPVLVTGAGGFIASHLVEALIERGFHVRAMVHYNFRNNWGWLEEVAGNIKAGPPRKTDFGVRFPQLPDAGTLEIIAGDIQDPFFVNAAVKGCKIVFHLAALIAIPYSYVAPSSYVSTNVQGTLNVLQACRDNGVSRLVHTSTSAVYGTAQYTPIDEKHPVVGQSPYSASKIGADHLAESFYRSFDSPVSIVRPFNTFGPRQSARAVIPTIITQALSGAEVIRLGSLSPVRDLNYVKDTVAGFLAVASSDKTIGQVTNIGRGEGISIGGLAQLILDICGCSAVIENDPQRIRPEKSEVFRLVCDNNRAQKWCGWGPRYSLEEGLTETVAWVRNNLKNFKSSIYNL